MAPAFVTALKAFFTALRQHREFFDNAGGFLRSFTPALELCDSTETFRHTALRQRWELCDSTESFLHNFATALGALQQHWRLSSQLGTSNGSLVTALMSL